ncbi:MAG: methylmalonyl-CoA mutase [Actinomycetota bacterium]|nr:methylmalonyl-CoA mutase [Actinomycetota bacterium]
MTAPDPGGRAGVDRIRVVLATPGDAEDRATGTVARGLRDAGMEVVHAGRATLEQLADTVVQEDADAVGLPALLADAAAIARLTALLEGRGAADVVVFACGVDAGLPGLGRTFPAGTAPAEIAGWLRGRLGG